MVLLYVYLLYLSKKPPFWLSSLPLCGQHVFQKCSINKQKSTMLTPKLTSALFLIFFPR